MCVCTRGPCSLASVPGVAEAASGIPGVCHGKAGWLCGGQLAAAGTAGALVRCWRACAPKRVGAPLPRGAVRVGDVCVLHGYWCRVVHRTCDVLRDVRSKNKSSLWSVVCCCCSVWLQGHRASPWDTGGKLWAGAGAPIHRWRRCVCIRCRSRLRIRASCVRVAVASHAPAHKAFKTYRCTSSSAINSWQL